MISEVYCCLYIKLNQFDLKSATVDGAGAARRSSCISHDIHSTVMTYFFIVEHFVAVFIVKQFIADVII